MSGDLGAVIIAVGSLLATVFGFVLALQSKGERLSAADRAELVSRRKWFRIVNAQVLVPVRDWFAVHGHAEPVDFDALTRYPPDDEATP